MKVRVSSRSPLPESSPTIVSDSDMDIGEDFKISSKGKLKSYEVDYDSLSQAAVEKIMRDDADHIRGILGVEVGGESSLLLHNAQAFVERHCETTVTPCRMEQREAYREVYG